MKEVLLYAIAFANLVSLVHFGLFMVGANVYDVKQFRAKGKASKAKRTTKAKERKPLISIIVPAHNEALGIVRTLESIRSNRYQNKEIIIVDDGSTDATAAIVREYVQRQRSFKPEDYRWETGRKQLCRGLMRAQVGRTRIILVSQVNKGKGAAMNNGIANFASGELVMCLDGDSVLHPQALQNAVRHFEDASVMGVAANVRVMGNNSWLAVLQRFEHMIGYRSKKFYTLAQCEFIIGGVASTYRRDLILKAGMYDTDTQTEDIGLSLKLVAHEGNREKRIMYAADVVASTEGVQTYRALIKQRYRWKLGSLQNLFKYRRLFYSGDDRKYTRRLTVYRLPMAVIGEFMLLLQPLLLGYIVYVSVTHHAYGILLGAYLTITAYTLMTIWPDEHFSNRRKLRMSFMGLGVYLLFYAMDLVQIAAVVRCLVNYRKITKPVSSTWVSPARATQAAAVTF